MAWDILPKANLQYFLTKLKNKFLMLTNYNKLGAKNILPYPYAYGSGTVHGLTVTVNDDGSVTASGQPTQNVAFTLVSNIITEYDLQVGDKLIFSESNVENNNASAALVYVSPSGAIDLVQGDYELTVTSDMVTRGVSFILWFNTGVDLTTPVTFKPMLRLDTDPDPTWVSPAFSNRKLTELVVYLNRTKSHVSANPSTTTGTLTSIEIDGTAYAVQGGGGAVTGVKGNNEQNYRIGDVNLTAKNVQALWIANGATVNSLDEFVNLMSNSGNDRCYAGVIKINSDIGVGVTGWTRIFAIAQNSPNNQQYSLGMFCIFFPADSSNIRWALIDGHTTGSYTVTGTGILPYTDHTYNFSGSNFHSGNGSTEEHNANNAVENGHYYYTSNGPGTSLGAQSTDGSLYVQGHSTSWLSQIAQDYRTGYPYVRGRNNGSWTRWREVMVSEDDTSNVTMDDIATWGNTMGMANLKSANANINPNNQTGWHHFINISYQQHNGTNMWQTQFAVKAGDSNVYFRSRGGGSVSGAAWATPWTRLAKASEIPSVGNGTLTIQQNGSNKATFTANQGGNSTANIIANKTEFTTVTTNFAVSVGAYSDGVYSVNAGPPQGYSTLAVIGVYTGMTTLFALRWGITSGNTARIDLHNVHSATVSGTASVTFLCYKNST